MKNKMERTAAIVLAAGSGSRMGTAEKKQYMELGGMPLICHALRAFEESFVADVVLVVPQEDIDYCAKEIVERFGLTKVRTIVAGGAERYLSVAAGLQALGNTRDGSAVSGFTDTENRSLVLPSPDIVFIHDGARPFITQDMLQDLYDAAVETGAAVAAMPVKNTIKIADADAFVIDTPDRTTLWEMQTPQVFSYELIGRCYKMYMAEQAPAFVPTDDAQLVERYSDVRVKLVKTSYTNLKITTPEDLVVAERICQ